MCASPLKCPGGRGCGIDAQPRKGSPGDDIGIPVSCAPRPGRGKKGVDMYQIMRAFDMAPQHYRHPFKECWVRGWANRLHLRCMNLSLGAAAVLEGVASSLGGCGRQGCLSQRVRGEDCHEVTRTNEGYWARIHGDDPRPAPNCCCRGCRGKGRGQKDDREGGCKCRNCRGLGLGLLIGEWGRRRRGAQSFALRSLFGVHMMSRMVVARRRLACEHGAELRSGLSNVCLGWDSAEHALWAMCALFLALVAIVCGAVSSPF